MRVWSLLVVVAWTIGHGSAVAQSPAQTPPPPIVSPPSTSPTFGPPAEESDKTYYRYGHHILFADVAAVGLTIATREPAALLSYLLTGPIVHMARGNTGRAIGSAALRAGAPIVGAMLGYSSATCGGPSSEGGGEGCIISGLVGGVAGMGVAVFIDWVFLGVEPRPRTTRPIAPVASVSASGDMQLGLAGHF